MLDYIAMAFDEYKAPLTGAPHQGQRKQKRPGARSEAEQAAIDAKVLAMRHDDLRESIAYVIRSAGPAGIHLRDIYITLGVRDPAAKRLTKTQAQRRVINLMATMRNWGWVEAMGKGFWRWQQ